VGKERLLETINKETKEKEEKVTGGKQGSSKEGKRK
jgi:hypothetical protein